MVESIGSTSTLLRLATTAISVVTTSRRPLGGTWHHGNWSRHTYERSYLAKHSAQSRDEVCRRAAECDLRAGVLGSIVCTWWCLLRRSRDTRHSPDSGHKVGDETRGSSHAPQRRHASDFQPQTLGQRGNELRLARGECRA